MNKEMFRKISDVIVDQPDDWSTSLYLTLDIDWSADEVILDAIELVEKCDVQATWFVTHETKVLERLRRNPKFELGIHPNFNFLLQGDPRNGRNAEDVVDRLLNLVPEARSVRSHSTTQNSGLLDLFVRRGLTHECNSFIPAQAGIELRPWKLWSGLTRVPYSWEDDVACLFGPEDDVTPRQLAASRGLKVFDFHPIHLFLNTESLQRYERTRPLHRTPTDLLEHRFDGYGARSRLLECLSLGQSDK